MKKLLVVVATIFLLSSCATTKYTSPRGVSVGMTKEEVGKLVGKSCRVVSTKKASEGTYEMMEYVKREKGMSEELFTYYFFNDKLTEWNSKIVEPNSPKKNKK